MTDNNFQDMLSSISFEIEEIENEYNAYNGDNGDKEFFNKNYRLCDFLETTLDKLRTLKISLRAYNKVTKE